MNTDESEQLNVFEKVAVDTQRLNLSRAAKRATLLFAVPVMAFQVVLGLVQGFSLFASVVGSVFGLLIGATLFYLFSRISIGAYRSSVNAAVGFELTENERAELVQWYFSGWPPTAKRVWQARSTYLNFIESSQLHTPLRRKLFFRTNRRVLKLRRQLTSEGKHG